MSEFLEVIKTRRSVRQYKKQQIRPEELDAVLEAGTYAPSGRGMQAAVIVAVQNEEVIQSLSTMNAEIFGVETDPYYGAPTIVLVFADPSRSTYIEDGTCVLENMMLEAHALGLGTCWIHREREMFEREEGKQWMRQWGLASELQGIGAIALGYADGETKPAAKRKDGYIVKVL